MSRRTMFRKIISILPREKLEEMVRDHCSVERPWVMDRDDLEVRLIVQDSRELRNELIEYIKDTL